MRHRARLPDEFGLRTAAHVREIDQRIWTLRVVGVGLRWAVLPGWGAMTAVLLGRTLQTGTLWSLPGLGIAGLSLGTMVAMWWTGRTIRKEIDELEAERFGACESGWTTTREGPG
jgi:hypothetical protein